MELAKLGTPVSQRPGVARRISFLEFCSMRDQCFLTPGHLRGKANRVWKMQVQGHNKILKERHRKGSH